MTTKNTGYYFCTDAAYQTAKFTAYNSQTNAEYRIFQNELGGWAINHPTNCFLTIVLETNGHTLKMNYQVSHGYRSLLYVE